jgi:polysaccharide biosynthesis/export protein
VRIAQTSSVVRSVVIAGLLATGCFGRALSPPPPDPTPMDRPPYTIGVTDVLKITVYKAPELSIDNGVPVRTDGMISVPLINDVQAEGLTPEELKDVISRQLSEYISEPNVTVIVLQMNSRFVSVIGEVGQDTRVPLTRDLRVLEAIASAGGFGPFADKSDVRIVRRNADGTESEYRFDYDAYIRGRAPGTNIVLQHGDTIVVPD